MSENLPAPLVPAEVDLRGLEWMPYYGDRLARSEFNARADDGAWRAGHNLWWSAWNSVPAGSLPDDEIALTRYADLGRDLRAFRKIRERALHGFVRCTDGRLYHPFLAKLALEAWDRRVKERDRKARWRSGQRRDGDGDNLGDTPQPSLPLGPGPDADRDGRVPVSETADRTGEDRTGQDRESPSLRSGERAQGAPNGRKSRKSRIATDWQPDEQDREYAASKGFNEPWIAEQSERFRDHHTRNGSLFVDWHAAWRTWVQRAPEFTRAQPDRSARSNGVSEYRTPRSPPPRPAGFQMGPDEADR